MKGKKVDAAKRHNEQRYIAILFALLSILIYVPSIQSKAQTSDIEGIESTNGPEVTQVPTGILFPSNTPSESSVPNETGIPSESSVPNEISIPDEIDTPKPTLRPTKTPFMKAVSGVKLTRYSTTAIKVTWKKHKKAKVYRVYCSKKNGKAKLVGTTKRTQLMVKKLKNNTSYFFGVMAYTSKKASAIQSKPSKIIRIKTKKYVRKTIFAGDSICEGIGHYTNTLSQMDIGGIKKVVAYRGLNTVTFHTKRVFDGETGLQKLISEKPYRIYMMLGINEIHYRTSGAMIVEYEDLVQAIKKESPNTDIVLCALSPVSSEQWAKCSGFRQIPTFNEKLNDLARKTGTTYFDYTGFLKDSNGYLSTKYAAKDGYHWNSAAYAQFAKIFENYDKSLDR